MSHSNQSWLRQFFISCSYNGVPARIFHYFFIENISLPLSSFSLFLFLSRQPSNTKIERFRSLGILEPTLSRAGYYSVEHKTLCDPWRPISLWKRVEFNRATPKLRRMIMRNCRVRNGMSKFSLATSFGSK